MRANKNRLIPLLALLYLFAMGFFAWGLAVGKYQVFPWNQLDSIYSELHAYFTFKEGPEKSTTEKVLLHHQENRSEFDFGGLKIRDANFQDHGYLLISGFSKTYGQVVVELFSIAENRVLHRWIPDIAKILENTPTFSDGPNMEKAYRVQHPLLLEDGGLVFTSGAGPMVKINSCSDIEWVLVHKFHHSIERDHQGNIVTCSKIDGDGPGTLLPIRDDAIAVVSPDGTLSAEYSITKILLKNGRRALVYGIGRFEHNRIHLNDAQPIIKEAGVAKIGDVLISSRHLSTIALLDPKSGTIKWLKTGPWLNQHDINQLPDGRYSIFGNDMVRGYDKTGNFLAEKGVSNIYIYDPATDTVTKPYATVMREEKIGSLTQGRSRILANGDVFIEQTDSSRMLRISEHGVRWEYVNAVSENTVGALHWSRYLAPEEIDLTWLDNLTCK
jgi:hypothetical protein